MRFNKKIFISLLFILIFSIAFPKGVRADFADGDGDVDTTTGNVGIGNSTPTAILHIEDDASGDPTVRIHTGGNGNYGAISLGRTSDELKIGISAATNNWVAGTVAGDGWIGVPSGKFHLGYNPSDTSAAMVLNGGNVGIGTTSPLAQLEIVNGTSLSGGDYAGANLAGLSVVGNDLGLTSKGGLLYLGTNDAAAAEKGGSIAFGARYDESMAAATYAAIKGGSEDAGPMDGFLAFATRSASPNQLNEVMRINSAGNVGINVTSPLYPLHVHIGNDQNFMIREPAAFATSNGIMIQSVNDANSANKPMELRASEFSFQVGNVGIGTTSPTNTFHVFKDSGGTSNYVQIEDRQGAAYAAGINFSKIGASWYIGAGAWSGSTNYEIASDSVVRLMVENTTGNVGIGTTSPSALLDLYQTTSDTTPAINITDRSQNAGDIGFYYNNFGGTGPVVITNNGDVGIGTTTPTSLLHVASTAASAVKTTLETNQGGQHALHEIINTGTTDANWSIGIPAATTRLTFYNSTSSIAAANAKMVIEAGGNVGIGTTTVYSTGGTSLHIQDTTNNPGIIIDVHDANTGIDPVLVWRENAAVLWSMGQDRDDSNKMKIGQAATYYGYNESTFMTWDTSGNVGIGTTSPGAPLHIEATDGPMIKWNDSSAVTGGSISHYGDSNGVIDFIGTNVWFDSSAVANRMDTSKPSFYIQLDSRSNVNKTEFHFIDDGGTDTTLMHLQGHTANVGIGITSPAAKLDVNGTDNSYTAIFQSGQATDQAFGPMIRAGTSSSDDAFVINDATNTNGYFRVKGDGNVGIGTTTPTSLLHVFNGDVNFSNATTDQFFFDSSIGRLAIGETANLRSQLQIGNSTITGSSGSTTDSLSNEFAVYEANSSEIIAATFVNSELSVSGSTDEATSLVLSWKDSANDISYGAKILAGKENDYTSGATADSYLSFYTTLNNAIAEKVRIDSSGNVGIGVTSPTHLLNVEGAANITGNLEVEGNFIGSGQFTGSSRTKKKDITPLTKEKESEILETIENLELVSFRYKNQENETPTLGVIAEESPDELLSQDKLSVNSVTYSTYALAGIKQLKRENNELKQQVEELNERLNKLETQNTSNH